MRAEFSSVRAPERSAPGRLVSNTRRVGAVDSIATFAAAGPSESCALWMRPATGEAVVGIGSAAAFDGSPERVAADWRSLVAEADIDPVSGVGPRLLGGFRFDPCAPATRLWDGFGDGRLILPEQSLTIRDAETWLTTNRVDGAPPPAIRQSKPAAARDRLGGSPADWQSLVGDVAAAIGRGQAGLRKVVLARAARVRVQVSLEAALRALAAEYPSCTIFAIRGGDACFLGATPEHLVSLHDGTATTMALAGSAPRGATPEEDRAIADRLLHDPKERTEHAVVADMLREALAPLASRVVAEAEPRVHVLPNLQHLITPIRAQIRDEHCVLDLVAALHPTPAVGGYPRRAALDLIRKREELDRGWYAGPIGWVDAGGQGEFVVGLRSALVRGEDATLFAGCGIVADSDPPTELVEWGWKARPMANALGVED